MATVIGEELTLIDGEENKEYSLIVSEEDATRANKDHIFAYSLLQQAKREAKERKKKAQVAEVETESAIATCSQVSCYVPTDDAVADNKEQHIWSRLETLLLLSLYKEHEEDYHNPKTSSKKFWEIISNKMAVQGYIISGTKCATKFQCLKRTYKTINDHNKKSGNNRKKWEYYETMHDIFSSKPWIEPVAIAGNGVVTNNENIEKDSQSKSDSKKRKLDKILEDYLEQSLQIQKGKENNAQKRHEEKMARLARIEKVLTESIRNNK